MTQDEIMKELDLDSEEFNRFYFNILDQVRWLGTHGVRLMLQFVEQELAAGRESI